MRKKDLAVRFGLAAASLVLAFLLCEAALRVLFPKYRGVAEGQLQPDAMRIYAQLPNTRDWWAHPDKTHRHPFHTNNLGLRQHRDFSDEDILSATTVGVFGDSFVQAKYLDAPHVFTEPLDYLLNLDGDFTVLNFGVGGYGPAQSYFHYNSFPNKDDLDHVLFVYFGGNDLVNLYSNRLFDLDDGGRLRQREVRGSSWWVPFASKLHLTYLALDATGSLASYVASLGEDLLNNNANLRLVSGHDVPEDRLEDVLDVFGQLIGRWREEVEGSGGKFHVVLLPTQPDFPRVRPLLEQAGVGVIDLNACYERRDQGHRSRAWLESPYRFENDRHWNELGNRLAAACLDARLRREAGLPAMSEPVRDAALSEYYAAFESPRPPSYDARGAEARAEEIRRKYQALGALDDVTLPRWSLSPDELVVDSNRYDVYFDGSQLVFHDDDCHVDDATTRLFAHATPVDTSLLPADMSYLVLASFSVPFRYEGKCTRTLFVPRFPLAHIHVGQIKRTREVLWSGEIFIDQAAFEKTLGGMLAAAGEPVIESAMDVHVHGRQLFYVSNDCQRTDGQTPFFLHVTPMREADLPPKRIEHGYDNQDFVHAGVAFGDRCVVRWLLPDYPVRHIRTGQFVEIREGEQVLLPTLWEGEGEINGLGILGHTAAKPS